MQRTGRATVLAFAHNSHLKCGQAEWQWGPQRIAWWPAGEHVRSTMGKRYAVIGVGVGTSGRWASVSRRRDRSKRGSWLFQGRHSF